MISAIDSNSTTQAVNSETAATGEVMGKDDFLNLLVTQLKYQDPLNPVDSAEFTAQLAQFSSLEQLYNISAGMDKLDVLNEGINNMQAMSYIGKEVYSYQNSLNLTEGNDANAFFGIDADAAKVSINITDSNGNSIRTIGLGATSAGQNQISWDGLDNHGAEVENGIYTFEVLAYDNNDKMINTTSYTKNTITGITYNDGEPYLNSGQLTIPLSSMFKISDDQT
jgi:flagellar basal-body rod modification protein FlgD